MTVNFARFYFGIIHSISLRSPLIMHALAFDLISFISLLFFSSFCAHETSKGSLTPGPRRIGPIAGEIRAGARNTARNKVHNWPHANKCERVSTLERTCPGKNPRGLNRPQWNSFRVACVMFARVRSGDS